MSSAVPTPATINSSSTSNKKVVAVSGERVQAGTLNLPVSQAISIPHDIKHEILTVPSSSNPAFGSYFNLDIRDINLILHNITLMFVTGAVIGSSGMVGCFNPAYHWINHIDIVQAGVILQTVYGDQQFLINQLLEYDEDRLAINNMAGNYASVAQRTQLSSQTTTNTFYVNLRTYFDEANMNLLTSAHNIQLRVFMNPLDNCFAVSSGTLTSCSINSCSAICSVSRLDQVTSQQRLGDMMARGQHHIFHDLNYFPFTIPAGTKKSTTILSGIVGNVSSLFFTVRASTTTNQKWIFKQIESFALTNSGSTNIVGGQDLQASLCANLLNSKWCKSSYNTETSFGTNDNSANFYCWGFSADPVSSLSNGQALGTYKFTGQEQLVITLPSAYAGQLVVDVYANLQMVLHSTVSSVKKEAL
jgi:hypothetical protein